MLISVLQDPVLEGLESQESISLLEFIKKPVNELTI